LKGSVFWLLIPAAIFPPEFCQLLGNWRSRLGRIKRSDDFQVKFGADPHRICINNSLHT
jgi:hypothetical protein